MAPTVSVNLCCYNSERYLEETLRSVIGQTYRDWELVIIDDGSTDATEAIVQRHITQGYPITYHYQENHGLGYSRNEALKRSRGAYIAFIDHDDLWMPDKLARQVPLFARDARTALVASNAIQFGESRPSALFCRTTPPTGSVFRNCLSNYWICLSTAVIRRDALDELDEWFDPRFRHIEEAELFTRIAFAWHLDYVDAPLAKNRIHQRSSTYLSPELAPRETEIMLGKFIAAIPDFERLYHREVAHLRFYVEYGYALLEWRQGQHANVRRRLRPFLFSKGKALFPYLLSPLPFAAYDRMLRYYRRYVRRIPVA
jgi:glycosyltransferase involved in cell wall biosynthesis